MLNSVARPIAPQTPPLAGARPFSRGEVGFLWWFIQGSIMTAEVRKAMLAGWGLCERHTFAWLVVEAAFRNGYLHGPVVMYDDLMGQAQRAFDINGPMRARRLARHLRPAGPCLLCALEVGPDSDGFVNEIRLNTGRDVRPLHRFIEGCRPHWEQYVCGRCAGEGFARCRRHLLDDIDQGREVDIEAHAGHMKRIAAGLARFERSFSWERRGSATAEDRAALIAAAGWCAGWRSLLGAAGQAEAAA
jgi:hypothetical protein